MTNPSHKSLHNPNSDWCRYKGIEINTGEPRCLLLFYAMRFDELPDEILECERCVARVHKEVGINS